MPAISPFLFVSLIGVFVLRFTWFVYNFLVVSYFVIFGLLVPGVYAPTPSGCLSTNVVVLPGIWFVYNFHYFDLVFVVL